MLTERVVTWVDNHLTESPFTEETQALIDKYASPRPPARRVQYQELALVVAHALIMLPFVLAIAFTGEITTRLGVHGATGVLYRIAVAGLTWCCVGLGIHIWRFYDALFAIYRSRREPSRAGGDWRWPRASSDRDVVAQTVVAVVAALLV
jgi:hypothetical protein